MTEASRQGGNAGAGDEKVKGQGSCVGLDRVWIGREGVGRRGGGAGVGGGGRRDG